MQDLIQRFVIPPRKIQRFVIPPLSKAQQFFINILCGIVFIFKISAALAFQDKYKVVIIVQDYYEQKSIKHGKKIADLENQNKNLLEENESMRSQVLALQHEKTLLSNKLKAANNMLRILTKTKEDTHSCKTPVKIDVSNVDCLLQRKLNETTNVCNKKKNVCAKPAPAKVVHNKEIKKVALPKGTENVSCVKKTLKKDTLKTKGIPSCAAKTQPKILRKNPTPKKSVMVSKGRENQGTSRNLLKTKETGKSEQKTGLAANQIKAKITKRLEPIDSKVRRNLNETFVVEF